MGPLGKGTAPIAAGRRRQSVHGYPPPSWCRVWKKSLIFRLLSVKYPSLREGSPPQAGFFQVSCRILDNNLDENVMKTLYLYVIILPGSQVNERASRPS